MKKLKEIEKILKGKVHRSDNGQILIVRSCDIGENFYDYHEEKPSHLHWFSKELQSILENDHRVHIITCEDCCQCSGW